MNTNLPLLRKTLGRAFTVVMVVMLLSFMGTMAQQYYNSMRCIVGMVDTCNQPTDSTIVDSSFYVLEKPNTTQTYVVMANTQP